ncbi:Uncharacterised protein [uncultured archaeon]|nr:Uncharacterised protein [uncultured archaeon]
MKRLLKLFRLEEIQKRKMLKEYVTPLIILFICDIIILTVPDTVKYVTIPSLIMITLGTIKALRPLIRTELKSFNPKNYKKRDVNCGISAFTWIISGFSLLITLEITKLFPSLSEGIYVGILFTCVSIISCIMINSEVNQLLKGDLN